MPQYEFVCRTCLKRATTYRHIREPGDVPAPSCSVCGETMKRDFSLAQIQAMPMHMNDDLNPKESLEQIRRDRENYEKSWEREANADVLPGVNASEEHLREWALTGT